MKKLTFYILGLLILSSCSSQKISGAYIYSENKNNQSTSEQLTLKKDGTFEYHISNYFKYGSKNESKGYTLKGKGVYAIKNESIYLNFMKKGFDYKNHSNELLFMNLRESKKEKAKVKINFGYGNYNVLIVKKDNEILKSDFDGIAELNIAKTNFPIDLIIDFSKSDYHFFKNYNLILDKYADYDIEFNMINPIEFDKDIILPISKSKVGIKIGKMKNVL